MPCLGGRCSGRPLPFAHGLTVSSNASEGGTILDTRKEETVDSELDRLITRRAGADRRPCPDALEPSYRESVRRFNAARRAENAEAASTTGPRPSATGATWRL